MNLLKENIGQTFHEIAVRHYPVTRTQSKESLLNDFGFDAIKEKIEFQKGTSKALETFGELVPISEVIRIGTKYRLRLGTPSEFNGPIDENLFGKLSEFKDRLQQSGQKFKKENVCILAPKNMFHKDAFSKRDPVLFYQVNDKFFYLIHQWGGEMNRVSSILNLPVRSSFYWLASWVILPTVGSFFGFQGFAVGFFIAIAVCFFGSLVLIEKEFSKDNIEQDIDRLSSRSRWAR